MKQLTRIMGTLLVCLLSWGLISASVSAEETAEMESQVGIQFETGYTPGQGKPDEKPDEIPTGKTPIIKELTPGKGNLPQAGEKTTTTVGLLGLLLVMSAGVIYRRQQSHN